MRVLQRICIGVGQQMHCLGKLDVDFISEQFGVISQGSWFGDDTGMSALCVLGGLRIAITRHGAGCGYVYFRASQLTLMSCYLTASDTMDRFRMKLDAIEDRVREIGGPLVVAGDFNARSVERGDSTTNFQGRYILDMATMLGLTVANSGDASTFRRSGCEFTTPDITLVTECWARAIGGWSVVKDYTGSDHQYNTFSIAGGSARDSVPKSSGARRRRYTRARRNGNALSEAEAYRRSSAIEVFRLLSERRPCLLFEVYNACIFQRIFSGQWKIQRLTLISKGRGDITEPPAYRPLCMLDSVGKLLERLMKWRLAESLQRAGGLSER